MDREHNNAFQMIADYEGDIRHLFEVEADNPIPILATRNMVMFPGVISPVLVGRTSSINLVKKLSNQPDGLLAIFCQKDPNVENPTGNDLFEMGVYAKIIRVLEMPGSSNITAIVQGLGKCQLTGLVKYRPYIVGSVTPVLEELPNQNDTEFNAAVDDLRARTNEFIKKNDDIPDEAQFALTNITNNIVTVNFVSSNMPFNITDKMDLLRCSSTKDRVFMLLKLIHKEMQLVELKQNIRIRTREDIDEQQREYFLQQQIKNIKEELGNGEGSPERMELLEQASKKKWSEDVEKVFYKELDRLDTLNPQSPDYSIQINYLQTMVGLPWGEYTIDDMNLKRAERILNHDHYGM